MSRNVLNLVIDTVGLILAILLVLPTVTGLGIHEWGALILAVVMIVHVALHANWYFTAGKELAHGPKVGPWFLYIIDIAIFITIIVTVVSGLMVSAYVMPTFGLYGPSYYVWEPIHAVAAKVFLALLIVHLALHWHWTVKTIRDMKKQKGEQSYVS